MTKQIDKLMALAHAYRMAPWPDYHDEQAALRQALQAALKPGEVVEWAVERWNAEVKNRPLVNKNRRTLDDTWRQVIRHFGGEPDALLGPAHDDLLSAAPPAQTLMEWDGPSGWNGR